MLFTTFGWAFDSGQKMSYVLIHAYASSMYIGGTPPQSVSIMGILHNILGVMLGREYFETYGPD
jgi:hypothetical protein